MSQSPKATTADKLGSAPGIQQSLVERFLPVDRFQPDPEFTSQNSAYYQLNQRRLAKLVGLIALGLPIFFFILSLGATCSYYSISHFYYAPFYGDILVISLAAIATFLFAYRGESIWENRLATAACIGAVGIALFPTEGSGCDIDNLSTRVFASLELKDGTISAAPLVSGGFFKLSPITGFLHTLSAAVLFGVLAFFTFFVFTRSVPKVSRLDNNHVTPNKSRRNVIYIISGAAIVASIAAIVLVKNMFPDWWTENDGTFWAEFVALVAFGISWIVKGRLFGFLDD